MTVYAYLLLGIVVYGLVLAWLSRPRSDDEYWSAMHDEQDRRERDERRVRAELYGRSV